MPSSRPEILYPICRWISRNDPKSVLDIGVGHGKWGFLAREYTDVWRMRMWEPKTVIHGIEPCETYVRFLPHLEHIYNAIFICKAHEADSLLERYDLIICVAVLEHMTKEEGRDVLRMAKRLGRQSFFATPAMPGKQGAVYGNEAEAHISRWTERELAGYGDVSVIKAKKPILFLSMRGG